MRRLKKQPVTSYNPWDWKREAGERVYHPQPSLEGAYIYDLVESRGRNKRDTGELTPRLVRKNGKPRIAIQDDQGTWYWL